MFPIALDKPHAGWKAAADWAGRFVAKLHLQEEGIIAKDMLKELTWRMSLGHKGIKDNKTCYKFFKKEK